MIRIPNAHAQNDVTSCKQHERLPKDIMGYKKFSEIYKFQSIYFIYVLNQFLKMQLQINDSFKYHRLKV